MGRDIFSAVRFVRSAQQLREGQKIRPDPLNRVGPRRNMRLLEVVKSTRDVQMAIIRLILSLQRKSVARNVYLMGGSNFVSVLKTNKLWVGVYYEDHRGYKCTFKVNVLKYFGNGNIGAIRGRLRCAIGCMLKHHDAWRWQTHKRGKCFTRKQRAIDQILHRLHKRINWVLDKAIKESRADPDYRFFFPELWSDFECEKMGLEKHPLLLKWAGALFRLGTFAEFEGDCKTLMDIDPMVPAQNLFRMAPCGHAVLYNRIVEKRQVEFAGLWCHRDKPGIIGKKAKALAPMICARSPYKNENVRVLFGPVWAKSDWHVVQTTGEWRLDKPEYDVKTPSRTTGGVHYLRNCGGPTPCSLMQVVW